MAIGIQPTWASLNQQLTGFATSDRNTCRDILNWFATIQNLGVAGLQAMAMDAGGTAQDGTNLFNAANYLQTHASVFFGLAAQTPAFNFDNELGVVQGAYGGQ